MRNHFGRTKRFFGWLLMIIGGFGVFYASVYQLILSYEMFGVIIGGSVDIIIPHITLLGYIGIFPFAIGFYMKEGWV